MADYQSCEPVCKGWSNDKKYRVLTRTGETCLLRVSDIECLTAKQKEYEIIRKFAGIGFPMSQPVSFGISEDGTKVHMLLTWVEGEDLERVILPLSEITPELLSAMGDRLVGELPAVCFPEDEPALEARVRALKDAGFTAVRLGRAKGNPQPERFWRKNGFIETGIISEREEYSVAVLSRLL